MNTFPATLRDLAAALAKVPAETPTVFVTDEGDIGGGYHVTELKLADIESIDCGARQDRWREAQVQLLDGQGRSYMTAGKLAGILDKSLSMLPGLAEVPFSVEFAHGNRGLSRYTLGAPVTEGARITLPLAAERAQCKPLAQRPNFAAAGCCG